MPKPDRKRGLAVGGILVAILAVMVWFTRGGETSADIAPGRTLSERVKEVVEVEAPPDVETPEAERRALEPSAEGAVDEEAAAATEEAIDRSARGGLRIRVTDRFDTPIALATVLATGFRSEATPGTGYGWRWGTTRDKTDTEGIAELDYPVWVRGTQGQWLFLSKVIFTVEHPEYSTTRVEGSVEEEEIHVVLAYGSVLIVSGWIDSPTERILDLDPLLCYDARVGGEDWVPVRDGRLSCNRIPLGRHIVVLRHERDGIPFSSEGAEFELVESDQKELHLQLLPPRTLRGTLDPRVPRPVEHGQVRLAVESGARERAAVLMQYFSATVAPDGSFGLEDLPPGEIEIIGLCDGWTSVSNPAPDNEYVPRTQVVPEDNEGMFVLLMEPAARLEVTVLDPAGVPLEGAMVQMSPNVHWKTGYSQIFASTYDGKEIARRQWFARTDESGVARLANLPPKKYESVIVRHQHYRMRMAITLSGQERRGAWVDLESGEVAKLTVQLEEGED